MNYLEEQTDGEAMINSIRNGEHPLPVVAQVSLAETAPNAPHTLNGPKFWIAKEKRLKRLIIYGMLLKADGPWYRVWSNKIGKPIILYVYGDFKATEGETICLYLSSLLTSDYDLKKCGYKKDNCELNYKFLNNLQPEWKHYGTLMRQTKNLMDINIDALYNILKQNQGDVNDAMGYKKKAIMVTSYPLALVAKKTKNYYAKPTKAKVKDYNYYKTKMLLAKKDSDEQVLLAEDQAWMESSSDSDQEINANMVFMAKMKSSLVQRNVSSLHEGDMRRTKISREFIYL
ncbi:hypothetical protein Tco_0572728 [Tanacetum coccineum]